MIDVKITAEHLRRAMHELVCLVPASTGMTTTIHADGTVTKERAKGMIDYDKIKLAHDLARKADCHLALTSNTFCSGSKGTPESITAYLTWIEGNKQADGHFYSLDDLIEKLQELTAPKPKYEPGDSVWIVRSNCPRNVSVWASRGADDNSEASYEFYTNISENCWRTESDVYPSREALIQSQIEYWTNLRNENDND